MARELQWSASGRTAHGARDDTSGGCEAFKDPETTSATDMEVDTDTPLRAKHSIPKHHSDDIVYEAYGFSDDHKQ
jgi:hypothetical protein